MNERNDKEINTKEILSSSLDITFSKQIKEELISIDKDSYNQVSLLSSFIKTNGDFLISGQEKIIVHSDDAKIIKFIYELLKDNVDDIQISFSYTRKARFNRQTQYILNILSHIDEVLSLLKINFLDNKIPKELVNNEKGIKGYLMGLFLSCGSCSNPKSSNYHLEIYTKNEVYSNYILKLVNKIKVYPFSFKLIKRKNFYSIYLKRSDEIASFIAYLGAYNNSLAYETYRLDREMQNYANRLEHLDYYNYNKSLNSSEEIINIINKIDEYYGVNNLTNIKLKTLCILRREYPEASYSELAKLMSEELKINVTKSNVNHLIIKIREIGAKIDK